MATAASVPIGQAAVPTSPEASIELGRIAGVYGVRGWLKIESWTDPREAIFDYRSWTLCRKGQSTGREISHTQGRPQGKGLVVQIPDVERVEAARELTGLIIRVARTALPPLAADEYYWADLEGLRVETLDGVVLGEVSHLLATGANDVVVVRGDRERLLPFVQPDVIRDIDLGARRMRVDWDPEF